MFQGWNHPPVLGGNPQAIAAAAGGLARLAEGGPSEAVRGGAQNMVGIRMVFVGPKNVVQYIINISVTITNISVLLAMAQAIRVPAMTQIMVIFSWKPSIWSINHFEPYPHEDCKSFVVEKMHLAICAVPCSAT